MKTPWCSQRPIRSAAAAHPVASRSLIGVLGLLALACGAFEHIPACEQATQEFHRSMNAQRHNQIFRSADPDFRAAQSEPQYMRFMESTRNQYGGFLRGNLTYKHVSVGTGGTVVSLQYASEFDKGAALEELRWRMADGVPKLLRYSISPRNQSGSGSPGA